MSNWDDEKKALWDEDRVVRAFCHWLKTEGWTTVETEKDYIDVVAERGDEKLYAEVKGKTKGRPGVGLDTLYGQLLRRMPPEEVGESDTRFAVVVPDNAEAAALRVPVRVRDILRIDVYTVSADGQVEIVDGP
jgi:hypothetical protein